MALTKAFIRFRERLRVRPLLYTKRDGEYGGVYCSRCVRGDDPALKLSKLTARDVWNHNYRCANCRYPEFSI